MRILTVLIALGTVALAQEQRDQSPPNTAKPPAAVVSDVVAVQVMLDRAAFSPGAIDGQNGVNVKRAVSAFQRANGLNESGEADQTTWQRLAEASGSQPPLVEFAVRDVDLAGPFAPAIPSDLVEQSKLPSLGYQNALEAIAERFHTTPQFLKQLNPSATFTQAGERLMVPNVPAFDLPQPAPAPSTGRSRSSGGATGTTGVRAPSRGNAPQPFRIAVTKSTSALTVEDPSGKVVFHAPVTTGSEHDPLPIGQWKITTVQLMPVFQYNPDLFWDANPSHSKARIRPGPNNPVGVAWIDLSKEHYGIHGTPEPTRIGHVQSHGCVRLTNWDVTRLLAWAQPGMTVIFRE
jgi:lipoprotein-anchoring transpeptidase ErfK/SrfK